MEYINTAFPISAAVGVNPMFARLLYASTISDMNATFDVSFDAIQPHRFVAAATVFKYVVTVHPLVTTPGGPVVLHGPSVHVTPVAETLIVALRVSYPDNDVCIVCCPSVNAIVLVSISGGVGCGDSPHAPGTIRDDKNIVQSS